MCQCYYFLPIKKTISHPFSTGMPKLKVCQRLKASNAEVCEIKYRECERRQGRGGGVLERSTTRCWATAYVTALSALAFQCASDVNRSCRVHVQVVLLWFILLS